MELKDIKNWGPDVEKGITEKWKKSETHKFNKNSKKKTYSIDTPPPYVNAPIHIGQAITYCYMDFFARYKRMQGFQVIFPLGLDRNGLPIEVAAEKEFGISPFHMPREKFIEYCKKILEKTSSETEDTFAKLGISFTSYKKGKHVGAVYLTDSEEYRKSTQLTFANLFRKGLVYEDIRINNWDTKLQTTIADSEIEYREIPSTFNFVRWKIKETGQEIVIATTRPELICTCGMIIFNPEDKKYALLEGKTAISPIFGKQVKIRSNPLADPEKGTGLAMMCSAGDLSDIQFFREEGLKPIIAINSDGTMNDNAGPLKAMKVKDARKKIIEMLKEEGLLQKQEQIIHKIPFSERGNVEVEFIEMPEFYIKQIEFKDKLKKIIDKINFYPLESKKILCDWIDSLKIDWPVSRRRFYATPIPLWKSGNKIAVSDGKEYCEPWKEKPKAHFEVYDKSKKIGNVGDFGKIKWEGETRVFDTWMDSSISELIILKYGNDKNFFKKNYPVSLRPQGKDIIRTWLYYSILRGYLETGKTSFENVWINQHIVDSNGQKMSKSKGNIIDPQKLLGKYGAEAIRFWAATEGDLTRQDLKCSEEKIKAELGTINKLLNITKFIIQFKKPKKVKLTPFDENFVKILDYETCQKKQKYDSYNFYKSAIELRQFIWDDLASNYIELIKARAYNEAEKFTKSESESAVYTLYYILERITLLLHPIIPQVTSIIASELSLDLDNFPKIKEPKLDMEYALWNKIKMFNSDVWRKKKESGLSLRSEISDVEIPKELKPFERDLKAAHNIN